jgi:glutamate racemase
VAAGADVLVLGCTHYSFLQEALAERVGPDVTIVNPAEAVARRVAAVAEEAGTTTGGGRTTWLTTGDPARFAAQVELLLGELVAATRAAV